MLIKAEIIVEVEMEIPDKYDKLAGPDFLRDEPVQWAELAYDCDEKVTGAIETMMPDGVTLKTICDVSRASDNETLYFY